jgi:hypothetical protein
MRRVFNALPGLVVAVAAGCGTTTSGPTLPAPSHTGTMVALPDAKGFFEIKVEIPDATRAARSRQRALTIVAYFYQSDGTTAMSPPPPR